MTFIGEFVACWSFLLHNTVFCGNFRLDFTGHKGECLTNIEGIFGRSLKESNIKVVSEFFSLIIVYFSLVLQILFVSNQNS